MAYNNSNTLRDAHKTPREIIYVNSDQEDIVKNVIYNVLLIFCIPIGIIIGRTNDGNEKTKDRYNAEQPGGSYG